MERSDKLAPTTEWFDTVHQYGYSSKNSGGVTKLVGVEGALQNLKFLVSLALYRKRSHILNKDRQEFLAMSDEHKMTGMVDDNQFLLGRFDDVKVFHRYGCGCDHVFFALNHEEWSL